MQLPKVKVIRELSFEGSDTIVDSAEGDPPEQFMDEYKKIVGDAQGKVSVGTDFSSKSFGKGASVMVNVSLACNQDQQTLLYAIDLAAALARYKAQEHLTLAEAEWEKLTGKRYPREG